MKGKITFVLGATIGYVLGTRAGRERYEQIKRGAQRLWATTPVQSGVENVREATQGKISDLKESAWRAGKEAYSAFTRGGNTHEPSQAAQQPQADAHAADMSRNASGSVHTGFPAGADDPVGNRKGRGGFGGAP